MQHAADMHEFSTGKDVAVDELAHAGTQLHIADTARRDAMDQGQSAGPEHGINGFEVFLQIGAAHMFEHAD